MPPLLKTLSARSIYSVKKLVLLSKSEQIFGLGAGLLGYLDLEAFILLFSGPIKGYATLLPEIWTLKIESESDFSSHH